MEMLNPFGRAKVYHFKWKQLNSPVLFYETIILENFLCLLYVVLLGRRGKTIWESGSDEGLL